MKVKRLDTSSEADWLMSECKNCHSDYACIEGHECGGLCPACRRLACEMFLRHQQREREALDAAEACVKGADHAQ